MNNKNKTLSDVLYPPVVTAHINKTMGDYFKWRANNKDEVQMHYSSQPNGHPHLGTMTSIMTAFAIGNFMQESFDIPTHLTFEQLENAPGYKIKKNDITYQLMLCDTPLENSTKLDVYMKSFKGLMNRLSEKSGTEYKILSYKDFQETHFVRESLIEILNREKEFAPLLNPSEMKLRVRFPCKKCKYMDEDAKTLNVEDVQGNYVRLSMECFDHGRHEIEITPDNKEFVDINTPIRNAIKERLFVKQAKESNALNLMVDGGDWVGMGELMNHTMGLWGYSANDLPTRIYTPLIEDWSGAKFSKSLYVKDDAYRYLPPYLQTYPQLMDAHGEKGVEVLWDEVSSWAREPKKLFRNYTVEYFDVLFKEKLGGEEK